MTATVVEFGEGVADDLDAILLWIETTQSPRHARLFLQRLLGRLESLAVFPQQGAALPAVPGIGPIALRQLIEYPYRILYSYSDGRVLVRGILDGRRDLGPALQDRLPEDGS